MARVSKRAIQCLKARDFVHRGGRGGGGDGGGHAFFHSSVKRSSVSSTSPEREIRLSCISRRS